MQSDARPKPRSAGSLPSRRVPLDWEASRDFRILAIDGGGIRGIFPSAVLAGLEKRYLGGRSVAKYFDMVVGTSTGGIIAAGLAAGLTASRLNELYVNRGDEIFPPYGSGFIGRISRKLAAARRLYRYSYDQVALAALLREELGSKRLVDAQTRLCIPSFEGVHGEVYIFKTPHHPDFYLDRQESMVAVGLATSAAPTYYRPFQNNGYTFVDGGVWANNPIMIGVTEALTSFRLERTQLSVFSIGTGDNPYSVTGRKISCGGMFYWRDIMNAAMRLQSQNALGQARLLLGPECVLRIAPPNTLPRIELDDWAAAVASLPSVAAEAIAINGDEIARRFFYQPVEPYIANSV